MFECLLIRVLQIMTFILNFQKETMENLLSLLTRINKEKKISLLDLGCGTGSFSKKISEKFA